MKGRNTREEALETIRVEVATHGKPTPIALRTYIENRISREAYQQAIREGMARRAEYQARGNGLVS